MFSDYECPVCARSEGVIANLLSGGDVQVIHIHYPLPNHEEAEPAARAAICADAQGKVSAYHERLFARKAKLDGIDFIAEAEAARIPDIAEFSACIDAPRTTATLKEHIEIANRLRVKGTPTLASAKGLRVGITDLGTLQEFLNATN